MKRYEYREQIYRILRAADRPLSSEEIYAKLKETDNNLYDKMGRVFIKSNHNAPAQQIGGMLGYDAVYGQHIIKIDGNPVMWLWKE